MCWWNKLLIKIAIWCLINYIAAIADVSLKSRVHKFRNFYYECAILIYDDKVNILKLYFVCILVFMEKIKHNYFFVRILRP